KFGLFIHWGIYSVLGAGEWVMEERGPASYTGRPGIPASQYDRLAAQFNPTQFDAREWVALAKASGMKYITITSKHHDGFAMYDSSLTDWNIVDRTPYGRDVLAELAEACREEGLKLFFYYSQLDWRHEDYFPRGRTGRQAGRPENGNWDNYIDFMNGQLRELLTNYGEIGGIWFDGMWDKWDAPWRLDETYRLIHQLQPQTLIGSNHHLAPLPGEDFQSFEHDLPGANTTGYNTTEIGTLPFETAETINQSWGFNLTDHDYKSTDDLIRYLVNAAGRNANFLLNVGPMPNGKIQGEFEERLHGIGHWLDEYGDSIYGTRNGPIEPGPWGVSTAKQDTVYLHVLNWNDSILALPALNLEVKEARLLRNQAEVPFQIIDQALLVTLPTRPADLIDEVVILTVE
ncbi:MAG TPA: alpha-L-fucosidase, partial [Acidobacteria bacterium]|nr:alpha-L-fucosidase [Acidobacteriota bacterium]